MASVDDVKQALLEEIEKGVKEGPPAQALLMLAEAYAWAAYPNQSHGCPPSS